MTKDKPLFSPLPPSHQHFFSYLGHALRSPVSIVLAHLEGLQNGLFGPLTAPQSESLHAIQKGAHRLAELATDISALARQSVQDSAPKLQEFRMNDVCRAATALVQEFAAHRSVSIATDVPESMVMFADAGQVRQMAAELLINGVAAAPAGGRVDLVIRPLVDSDGVAVEMGVASPLGAVQPPSPDAVHAVYTPTAQSMAITTALTERHGGELTWSRALNHQWTITATLPQGMEIRDTTGHSSIEVPASAATSDHAQIPTQVLRRMPPLILVVDDEEDMQRAISHLLEGNGFRVETAANGTEALDKAAELLPQLLILDMHMPIMDGALVIQHLRASLHPALRNLPIISLSGLDGTSERNRCLHLGASAYLPKPFRSADLTDLISALLTPA